MADDASEHASGRVQGAAPELHSPAASGYVHDRGCGRRSVFLAGPLWRGLVGGWAMLNPKQTPIVRSLKPNPETP
jgi:hypothetical protein